jgi:hypothetical protein
VGIIWFWNPLPANAANYICLLLSNNQNRITSSYAGGWSSTGTFFNNRPATLPLVRDYCHDASNGHIYNHAIVVNSNIIATRAISIPDNGDWSDFIQSWYMSQVADKLGCGASAGGKVGFPGINQVISMLPSSPQNMRIPTLITKMAGENSLAGNLAIELYSGAWQFLGILTSFKLFKIFFKGG